MRPGPRGRFSPLRSLLRRARSHTRPDFLHDALGAPIAITKGLIEHLACGVQPDVIDRPAIDTDRVDSARRKFGREAQPLLGTLPEPVEVPIQVAAALDRSVRKAMHQADLGPSAVPLAERDAATLSSQIDRDRAAGAHCRVAVEKSKGAQPGREGRISSPPPADPPKRGACFRLQHLTLDPGKH